jgi:hypothetical protein
MAYDAARGRVVLFGGVTGHYSGVSDETWEWDGTDWNQLHPSSGPAARSHHAIAYDDTRRRIVLFGGDDADFHVLGDTWEWYGTTWTRRTPPQSPRGRSDHALAFDAATQRVLLFGGRIEHTRDGEPDLYFADTWAWNGAIWEEQHPARSPTARCGHALASDPVQRRVVLLGGYSTDRVALAPERTWIWDGVTWRPVTVDSPTGPTDPVLDFGHAMAFDVGRARVVMFGGSGGSRASSDTWEYE